MKKISLIKKWVVTQFKTKPLQSYLITSVLGVLLVVGGLFAFGVFGSGELDQSGFSYLPKREYVLGAKEDERPETLFDLLHSESPDIEDFFHNPDIAAELLVAESLVDIVDSRYALNWIYNPFLCVELSDRLGE